jgi:hypothetical protein|nr:MAG TPA: tail assembly chaperone protein [Bacteriophage sp.]
MAEKRNTLETLLRLKTLKEKRETGTFDFKTETGDIISVNKLSDRKVLDICNNVDADAPIIELYDELIYEAMPELRTKEALEAFECEANPQAIVGKVFNVGDRVEIGKLIKESLDTVTVEQVKN